MKSNNFYLSYLLLFFLSGCTKNLQHPDLSRPFECDSMEFSFAIDIHPLITANCSGNICHSGGNSNYDYRRYEVISDRIRSGRLEDRLLLPLSDPMHMPVGRSLSPCDLYSIRTWIHQGFKNN